MNRQQYEIACGIIKVDCYGTGSLKRDGLTCAVGALYAAIDPDWAVGVEVPEREDMYTTVEEVFDLPPGTISKIYGANDKFVPCPLDPTDSVEVRRLRVLKVLKDIFEGEFD